MRFVVGKFNGTVMAINEQKIVSVVEEGPELTRILTTTGESFYFKVPFETVMDGLTQRS